METKEPQAALFGVYMVDRLEAAGLSQRAFARLVGLSATYLTFVKQGHRPPPDAVLTGLSEHAGCDIDEVYWQADRLPPDIESLVIEAGPEYWRSIRRSYYFADPS